MEPHLGRVLAQSLLLAMDLEHSGTPCGKDACTVIAFGNASVTPCGKDACTVIAFGNGSGSGTA